MEENKLNLKNVKLIIWDLDETLWNGTISEESVKIKEKCLDFINNTLDMGIVHSICSKNDMNIIKEKLQEINLWDSFVFPSIDWSPKGARIKNIISLMNLRDVNVLFIDDNIQNLNEAKFYCDGINIILPEELNDLFVQAQKSEKKDLNHKRLKQYKILEEKENSKLNYNNNIDFLMSCNIIVEICKDCLNEIDRLHELLMRSNQLNYTKFRQNKEDLIELLKNPNVNAGYIKVHDNFGDYGIVGFFAIKDGKAIHFLFSCRTLGMLVEQWVYKKIGCPQIDVVGEVVTKLNDEDVPIWINQNKNESNKQNNENFNVTSKILFKGPCDMMQIFSFIKEGDNIKTEFTYTNDNGITIEGYNHTGQITTALYTTEEEKTEILKEFEWFDKNMLTTLLSTESFDTVILSLLNDGNLGLYRRKGTEQMISLCEAYYDLTDKKNWKKYINKEIFTSNIKFTKEELERFKDKYEFINNENGDVTIENLEKIYNKVKTNKFIILLGSEKKYNKKTGPAYVNRHLYHKIINQKVKEWANNKENVILINMGDYIESDYDYVGLINHFSKKIYYKLAKDIVKIINKNDISLEKGSRYLAIYRTILQRGKRFFDKLKYKIKEMK